MATIDEIRTVERLMQTLDENPQLMEALRSRVLTRELLELPANHAKLAAWAEQIAEQLSQLTKRMDRLTERVDQIAEQLAQLTERVNQIAEQLAELVKQVGRLQNDVGTIKGFITDAVVHRLAPAIALTMGLSLRGKVDGVALSAMVAGPDRDGISFGDLESFLLADLIIETGNGDGETVYVAVEASYTVDRRDTDRAIRNAAYLTRFTGKPARAVVTGRHKDWNVDGQIESRAVLWYEFPADLLRGL